jgi:hypothetical protein
MPHRCFLIQVKMSATYFRNILVSNDGGYDARAEQHAFLPELGERAD